MNIWELLRFNLRSDNYKQPRGFLLCLLRTLETDRYICSELIFCHESIKKSIFHLSKLLRKEIRTKALVIFCEVTKGPECVRWQEENSDNFGAMYELAAPHSVGKTTASLRLYAGVRARDRSRGHGSCGNMGLNRDSAPVWSIRFLGSRDWSHLASAEPAGQGARVRRPDAQQWEWGQQKAPPRPRRDARRRSF